MAVIYQITNMINGKYYIGSAQSFERRSWQHKYDLKNNKHKNPKLQAAWNKYGEDAFVFEILEEIPEGNDQLSWENKHLHVHVGKPECYNINKDAELARLGAVLTDEAKKNISAGRIGKHAGKDHYRYGQEVSAEVRAKISATQAGRPNPRKGMPMSEQGRANVVAALKRGEESHFYGKRPANADDLQKKIYAIKADGTKESYPSLTYMRDNLGISIATIIRAAKSGKPIKLGNFAGWVLSYTESVDGVDVPDEYKALPRSRAQAKAEGAQLYFTGLPCDKGHIAPRKVKGTCTECQKIEWREQNKKRSKRVDTP